jgi:hypothetical protein
MTPLNTKLSIILFFLLVSVVSFFFWKKNEIVLPQKMRSDLTKINNGDLIFRKGRGVFSDIFRNIGGEDSPFSHVGIIYLENNEVLVIHTEASEVTGIGYAKKEKLNDFISVANATKYAFYRVQDIESNEIDSIVHLALSYVSNSIPFDTDFDLMDDDRLYCTELVYKAFKSVGFNILEKPNKIKIPSVSGMKNIEAITIGQLLKSEKIKSIPNLNTGEQHEKTHLN